MDPHCRTAKLLHTLSHTHTPIRMFRVNPRRRQLISKSSFSRKCIGRIHDDTCSQLTWTSYSPRTPGGTFRPTLTPGQTLYLHESCQNKPKSEVCHPATSPFDISVAWSSVTFMIHASSWVDTKLRTLLHAYTHTYIRTYIQNCTALYSLASPTLQVGSGG